MTVSGLCSEKKHLVISNTRVMLNSIQDLNAIQLTPRDSVLRHLRNDGIWPL